MFNMNRILTSVAITTIACVGLGSCVGGLAYNQYQTSELVKRINKLEKNQNSSGDDDNNDDDSTTVETLIDFYTDSNQRCKEIKKNISEDGSLADFRVILEDYVNSIGGEVVVKDGSALYSLMVAPKTESDCDDFELLNKAINKMTVLYPDVNNIGLKPHGEHDYVIFKIENNLLMVSDVFLYDISKSTKL